MPLGVGPGGDEVEETVTESVTVPVGLKVNDEGLAVVLVVEGPLATVTHSLASALDDPVLSDDPL